MSNGDLALLSIAELTVLLERDEVSSREATRAQLERIALFDARLNAYITVTAEQALTEADAADARRRRGERLPLLGVPLAVKNLYATTGVRTTAGSRILADFVPSETATAVSKLQAAGAVILGKTNMMEFAYGYPHPDYGETANPWDTSRTAGGSSGGSAAAVAAGMAYGALGSDTGGSIRSPAAYCGVVGLKPTYGRVSSAGVMPLAWSLDHCGPLARTVRDTALIYDIIAGHDPADPASAMIAAEPVADGLAADMRGRRVGIVEELFERHVQPEVRLLALDAVRAIEGLGITVEPVTMSFVPLIGPTSRPIVQAESASYHWTNFLARPDDYGPAVRERLRLGATVLAKDYLDAQQMRRRMTEEVVAALSRVDALVFPTQPIVAPLLGSYEMASSAERGVLDVEIGHTGLANLTGHPAVSVLCGFTDDGLPVALQITGGSFEELTILQLAHAYEQATAWHTRRPPLRDT